MKEQGNWDVIKTCYNCGKEFGVLYQHLWRYTCRGPYGHKKFFCSWKCLRAKEREIAEMEEMKRMRIKITPEQKRQAVDIAIDGGSPMEYLKNLGSSDPKSLWGGIKREYREKHPDLYAQIPDLRKPAEIPEKAPAAVETPEAPRIGGLCPPPAYQDEITTWEDGKPAERILKPVNYGGFDVRAVQGKFGRYSYDPHTSPGGKQYLDFENEAGDELSLTVDQWREMLKELKRAALVLGVEL